VIIVDTSLALQWVLPEEDSRRADGYLQRKLMIVSPDVLMVEVANVLAKKVRADNLIIEEAHEALSIVRSSVSQLMPTEPLVRRAMELSANLSHPVYDCVFLACAEAQGGLLATRDAPFVRRVTERGFGHLLEQAS
jgi:hypothetical protein